MSKYILKFEKADSVKYVSHLDLIRVFDRAMRRAQLPMGYSQGFNPHPLMTFAHPLGVGVSSIGELVEITTAEHLQEKEFLNRLQEFMPVGFKLIDIKEIEGKNNFARLTSADYKINIEGKFPESDLVKSFNKLKEILIDKKTKSGIKETDIRPFILSFEGNMGVYMARLKTGAENLKPELFLKALEKYIPDFSPEWVQILRVQLNDGEGNSLF